MLFFHAKTYLTMVELEVEGCLLMSELRKLPLFPLNAVLFPGMILPLHIFEPRYRLMIGRCIQQSAPFGVVLIREGVEVGGEAIPHEVGTLAHVTHVDRLPDGRMNIQVVGYQRFRIKELTQDQPYPTGMVEDYPLQGTQSPEVQPSAAYLGLALRAYLHILIDIMDLKVSLDQIPQDGAALAYFAAAVLPLPLDEKQSILATDDLPSILKVEQSLLRRERMLLNYIAEQERRRSGSSEPFSPN